MTTVGTVYDETIKFGFAKLLQVQSFSNNYSLVFVTPFTLPFHTFLFDLVNINAASTYDWLFAQVSTDSGASWLGANYYWGSSYSTSHGDGAGNNVSGTQANTTDGANTNVFELTGGGNGGAGGNPWGGEVIVTFRPGKNAEFQWHTTVRSPSYGQHNYFGGGVVDGACNAVRFASAQGGNFSSGIIRCYGLRMGV
jgi:hypothetical protein